jgi:hypothetical protein
MKKEIYATYAASFTGTNFVLYCFNKNLVNTDDFVIFEAIAHSKSMNNFYNIFNVFETNSLGHIVVCVN